MPRTYADLLAIIDDSEVVADQTPASLAVSSVAAADPSGSGILAMEADDDPHRLARVNLERYATRHDGRTLAYWRDEWYVWKKNAYRKISTSELRAKVSRSIKTEFDRICLEKMEVAAGSGRDGNEPIMAQKVSMSLVSNVIQATSGMVCVSSDVDPNAWLPTKERRAYLSMSNGLLDIDEVLADGDDYLIPNTPKWFSMVSVPYAFDPEAECPRWMAFLNFNLEGDPQRIAVLQEWAGYVLTPSTDQQTFLILEGEGKNGKSVYIAGLSAMLGLENISNISLENFGERFQLTDTIGKLLNAVDDCGDIDKVAEGHLKSFVSGARMYFDRKGVGGVNAAPTARLMVACNNRPRFSDRSDAVWRRMKVIPWRVSVPDEKRVRGMDKVAWWQDSGELPGIFRWALQGLARLRKQGSFSYCAVAEEAMRDYQLEVNPAKAFLLGECTSEEGAITTRQNLYKAYSDWCKENGHSHPLSHFQFGKEVKRRFPNIKIERETTGERIWYYSGLSHASSF